MANLFSKPLAILQIDFYKAFDSLSHSFLLQTASNLGIPPYLITWLQIILHNTHSKIIVNNSQTPRINIKRGIRQGCPLSMLMFIIGIEPLTRKLLSNPLIKGIQIGKSNLSINHYADDLTIFLTDPKSFTNIAQSLQTFSTYSGLQINETKTKLLHLSFLRNFPHGKINTSSKILGITFSFNPPQTNFKLEQRNRHHYQNNILPQPT